MAHLWRGIIAEYHDRLPVDAERAVSLGEGGTIPLMGLLGEAFPEAQFVITGVLGPGSNAHGPNEFLHLEMARRLTACVGWIVARA